MKSKLFFISLFLLSCSVAAAPVIKSVEVTHGKMGVPKEIVIKGKELCGGRNCSAMPDISISTLKLKNILVASSEEVRVDISSIRDGSYELSLSTDLGSVHVPLYIGTENISEIVLNAGEVVKSESQDVGISPPSQAIEYFRKARPPRSTTKAEVVAKINISADGSVSCEIEESRGSNKNDRSIVSWCSTKSFPPATKGGKSVPYSFRMKYSYGYGYNTEVMDYAKKGNAKYQLLLGSMYESGKYDVTQDYASAADWYRKSANQGNKDAQNNLGALYFSGRGVGKDLAAAYYWFSLSAKSGSRKDAEKNVAIVIRYMTSSEISRAEKALRDCFPENVEACL